ncbi:MAG: FMN-binding protein [Phycisphaerae bacterium]|nr:FMN-binding protein [Phycisphaerae bacterium]
MKGNSYTICYAAILGTVCALLLTGVAKFTEPYKLKNAAAEKNRNIFTALNIDFDKKSSAEELVEIFNNKIVEETSGDGLALYKYQESGVTKGIAVDFEGPGLWAPIKGFLALEPDMNTIRGITFYEQEETPGLGGEISTEDFRNRFIGKKIVAADGKPGIAIKAGLSGINEVDGITGATMTCDKVAEMLNKVIDKITVSKEQ